MRRPDRRHRQADRWCGGFRTGSVAVFVLLAVAAPLLTSAPASARAEPPAVAVVGDSVVDFSGTEIAVELEAAGRDMVLLTSGGATIRWSMPTVIEQVGRPDHPPIWVIALGHVDTSHGHRPQTNRRNIRELLRAVAPHVSCVRWFDVTRQRTAYAGVNADAASWNRILAEEVARYDNVEVFHYSHWARIAPDHFWIEDRIHHSAAGSREIGRLVRQAADGCDPDRTSGPFWDVPDSDPVAGPVSWVAAHHLMRGYANGTFRATIGSVAPTVNRGTVAEAAWRLAGAPRGFPPAEWSDVPRRLRGPLAWVAAEGLDPGTGSHYRPRALATRAHTTRLLWAAAGEPRVGGSVPWVDAPRTLRAALRWLAGSSDAELFPTSRFHPDRPVSRAQLVRLLAPAEVEGG